MSLAVEPWQVKPGGNFALNVTSTLNSSVSLLAVDQRIFSFGRNHDITKDFVFNHELMKYDKIYDDGVYDTEIPFWFYFESYQKKFIDVGAVILTNAIQEIPCRPSALSSQMSTESANSAATYSTSAPITFPPNSHLENFNSLISETFLFKTVDINVALDDSEVQGIEMLNETVPNFATSWIITGIAVSNDFGLGLTETPTLLNVLLYFYIELIVPVTVKIGEVFVLEILVINLFEESLSADVTFFAQSEQFNVLRPYAYNWTYVPGGHSQHIQIQNRSIYRLRIEIQPKVIGFIELKVTAVTSKAGDSAQHHLVVIPDGFPIFENHAEIVLLGDCDQDGKQFSLNCSIPPGVLNDTVQVHASVSGDILGPALLHLESLIRLPTGCGEQTLINFVPIVVVLNYLTITNRLTPTLNETAKGYLEGAYQRMFQYRHDDGSFSAFGKSDNNGSTWLTAYTVKYYREAQKYIDISEQVIADALLFIVSKQEPDGRFREDGRVIHTSLQSGTVSGVAFTSYVTAILQNELNRYPQFQVVVDKAINNVLSHYNPDDVYSLAIATYLLYQADDDSKEILLEQFLPKATKNPTNIFWKYQPPTPSTSSLDIEITAYALLILYQIPELFDDGFKALQWLISQQTSTGGYQSTQDTVIALEAISKFATKFSAEDNDLIVNLHPENGNDISTIINSTTSLMTFRYQLDPTDRRLDVSIKGKGIAIVQLSCSYYTNNTIKNPSFNLNVAFGNQSCDNILVLNICASLRSNRPEDVSGMVVFRVKFPSGFVFDADTVLAPEIQVRS